MKSQQTLGDVYIVRDCVLFFVRRGRTSSTLLCLFQNSRRTVSFSVNAASLQCLKAMDGRHTLAEIASKYGIDGTEVRKFSLSLERERIIERPSQSANDPPSRYRRQLNFFAAFETAKMRRGDYQRLLEAATVAIIGIGGIGTWVLESLGRSGIGKFVIIDHDVVERTNLPRQSLYEEADVGTYKVDAAATKVRSINRNVIIKAIRRKITTVSDLRLAIAGANLVINCADQPDISVINRFVSKVCVPLNLPHILCGGYDGHLSFIGPTVVPFKSACWECYEISGIQEKLLRGFLHWPITKTAVEGGTSAPIAAITANIHALEAIKVLTGYTKPLMLNCKAEMDFNTLSVKRTTIARQKRCPLCGGAKAMRRTR